MSRPKMDSEAFRGHWDQVKADNKAAEHAGLVMAARRGNRIQVVAPYKPGFPKAAREIAGRWRFRSRCWSFPASNAAQRSALTALIVRFHGADQLPDILQERAK